MRGLKEQLVVPVDDTTGRREQLVYAPNEYIKIVPYAKSNLRMALYVVLTVCTGGILGIVSVWFPQLFTMIARMRLSYSSLGDADYILVLVHEDGFRSTWIESPVHRPLRKKSGADKSSGNVMTPSDDRTKLPWVWFEFKKHRYVFNHEKGEYERYLSTVKEDLDKIRQRLDTGLDSFQASQKVELFGANLVDIEPPHIPYLLFTKVVHPFYLFQVFAAFVWFFEDYTIYATVILIVSAMSLTWEIYSEVSNSNRLRALVRSDHKIDVFRAGAVSEAKMITLHETDLVPGDIVELQLGQVVADVLLLSGGCVVDEAALTGEAVPINKEPVRGRATITDADARVQYKSSFLHAGSTITRIRDASGPCRGVVLSTGFSTGKGELFRSIIFPREITFEFERDSYRYLTVLSLIALAAFAKRVSDFSNQGYGFGYMIEHSLDLVTIAVPPALPLVLSSGIGFALNRLHQAGIFCIDSQRINSCGQLDTFCFDKTGTLTEESLKLVAVDTINENKEFKRVDLEHIPEDFRLAMATCHGLSEVDGQFQGYSLELSMFEKANLKLEFIHDRAASHQYLAIATRSETEKFGIVKRFPFDPTCQRSSVVVENTETKERFIFVKGSPEAIRAIAIDTPADFKQKSLRYAADGNYCIGFGVRKLAAGESIDTDKREAVETKVHFMGISLFHNELKPESKGMIKELYDAAIDVRVITGDNALTAVHVGRLLDMQLKSKVAIVDLNESSEVVYHGVEEIRLADQIQWELLTSSNLSRVMAEYDLALTGAALEQLKTDLSDESMKQLILETPIFARIRPTQKSWIVERLMDYGKVVGMCGDGTNDCGALKAAHVGLALSSAEASIVAPFTSKSKNVTDVPVLIREGRCALTTSFLGFKFMVLYPVIQLGMASTLGHLDIIITNNQYIWDDMAIVFGMAMMMLYTKSSTKLTKERPPNTLFSLSIVASILGQILLYIAFYAGVLVILWRQPWFCHRADGMALMQLYHYEGEQAVLDAHFSDRIMTNCAFYEAYNETISEAVDDIEYSHEVSATWLFAHMIYFSVAAAFNLKDKFRLPFYTNWMFTGYFLASLGVNLWFLLDTSGTINETFQMVTLTSKFRWEMFAMFVAHFILALAWEMIATWVLPGWRLKRQEARAAESKKNATYAALNEPSVDNSLTKEESESPTKPSLS